jgi:hypothetical protein
VIFENTSKAGVLHRLIQHRRREVREKCHPQVTTHIWIQGIIKTAFFP